MCCVAPPRLACPWDSIRVDHHRLQRHTKLRGDLADYKQLLIQARHRKNESILRGLSEGKEKCQRIGKEEYGVKEYLQKKCMADVRNTYRTRYGQRDFAGNFSKNNKYSKSNWMCLCLESKEKETHITSEYCPIYSDIREKYQNFDSDEDLVMFFDEVLERRDMVQSMEEDEEDFED